MAHDVHQVGGVAAIEHAERRVEAEPAARTRGSAGCRSRGRCRTTAGAGARGTRRRAARRAASASAITRCARRVISSAARRVKVSSSMRSGATPCEQQVRDAVRERAGLAGAGARDHEQRRGLPRRRRGSGSPWVAASRCAGFRRVECVAGVHAWTTIGPGLYGYPVAAASRPPTCKIARRQQIRADMADMAEFNFTGVLVAHGLLAGAGLR